MSREGKEGQEEEQGDDPQDSGLLLETLPPEGLATTTLPV